METDSILSHLDASQRWTSDGGWLKEPYDTDTNPSARPVCAFQCHTTCSHRRSVHCQSTSNQWKAKCCHQSWSHWAQQLQWTMHKEWKQWYARHILLVRCSSATSGWTRTIQTICYHSGSPPDLSVAVRVHFNNYSDPSFHDGTLPVPHMPKFVSIWIPE